MVEIVVDGQKRPDIIAVISNNVARTVKLFYRDGKIEGDKWYKRFYHDKGTINVEFS